MSLLSRYWQKTYKPYVTNRTWLISFTSSFLFLILSLYVNFLAGTFATHAESNPVTDIILSNIRVYDVDAIFIYGILALCTLIGVLCILNPKKAPFILKSIALFTIIRSVFISITHIGPFPTHIAIDPTSIINKFTFDGDLFFSGHTGLPFLMCLVFWNNKILRFFFLAASIVFGITVLIAHLHYSIDVLAAFFITYTIFHISEFLFRNDRKAFLETSDVL